MRLMLAALGVAGAAAIAGGLALSSHDTSNTAQARAAAALALRAKAAQPEAEAEARSARPSGRVRAALPPRYAFRPGFAVGRARLAATSSLTFGQPTISGINGVGFEEDIRLDPTNANRVYTSVPGTLSADTSWIWRSLDGGLTFKPVPGSAPLTQKVTVCAGGGDTELAVDSAGHLYFNDLTLANFSTARSDDFGASFTCSNTGVPDTAVDRQWYAADGDPTNGGILYLTNDEIGPGNPLCENSLGNNVLVMYRSPANGAPGATAGIQFGPANKVTRVGSCDEGIMGNNEVSPVATRTGQIVGGQPTTLASPVRHVYVIHDDATFTKIAIGRCFPVAFGPEVPNVSDPSGLNCVDLPVADLGAPGTVKTGANFPTMAIDRAGNLYAVWEQAPVVGGKYQNTSLYYSFSTNEGNTWSTPIKIPTPGLHNNVFAWIGAGDKGRIDIAWYGTPADVDPVNGGPQGCTNGGPDSVDGIWSLYVTQSRNALATSGPTFSPPTLAGEHFAHRGSIQTVLGGQCGDRTLGDFLQLRIGKKGEAAISYADSNNRDEIFAPHAMFVRQSGGPGVYSSVSPSGPGIQLRSATDRSGDGVYEQGGVTSPNMKNLDILNSSLVVPDRSTCHPAGTPCYRVRMEVADMSHAAPAAPDTDPDLVWLTQWLVPASPTCTSSAPSCADGGKNFFVYAESNGGGPLRCYWGENAVHDLGGGVTMSYPGTAEITAPGACKETLGPSGSVTIEVPISQVSLQDGVAPLSKRLYSVTASTMTLPARANSEPVFAGIGGVLFNLIDVARAYDVTT